MRSLGTYLLIDLLALTFTLHCYLNFENMRRTASKHTCYLSCCSSTTVLIFGGVWTMITANDDCALGKFQRPFNPGQLPVKELEYSYCATLTWSWVFNFPRTGGEIFHW